MVMHSALTLGMCINAKAILLLINGKNRIQKEEKIERNKRITTKYNFKESIVRKFSSNTSSPFLPLMSPAANHSLNICTLHWTLMIVISFCLSPRNHILYVQSSLAVYCINCNGAIPACIWLNWLYLVNFPLQHILPFCSLSQQRFPTPRSVPGLFLLLSTYILVN